MRTLLWSIPQPGESWYCHLRTWTWVFQHGCFRNKRPRTASISASCVSSVSELFPNIQQARNIFLTIITAVMYVLTLYLSMPSDYSQSFQGPMERVMNMKPIVCSQTSSKFIITSIHYIVSLLGVVRGISNDNCTPYMCVRQDKKYTLYKWKSGQEVLDIQVHLNKLECRGKVNFFQ